MSEHRVTLISVLALKLYFWMWFNNHRHVKELLAQLRKCSMSCWLWSTGWPRSMMWHCTCLCSHRWMSFCSGSGWTFVVWCCLHNILSTNTHLIMYSLLGNKLSWFWKPLFSTYCENALFDTYWKLQIHKVTHAWTVYYLFLWTFWITQKNFYVSWYCVHIKIVSLNS